MAKAKNNSPQRRGGAEPITAERLAECIARELFSMGDSRGRPCTRIEFKSGVWPVEEAQGGIIESALVDHFVQKLIEWGCPSRETKAGGK